MTCSKPTKPVDDDQREPTELGPRREDSLAALRQLHGPEVAGKVYGSAIQVRLGRFAERGELANSGSALIGDMLERMAPRDPLEEMLVVQAALAHARVLHLTDIANRQAELDCIRTANEYADRASNTYRRLMLALAEYRRPSRSGDNFTAIRQANIAGLQVVQNGENPASGNTTNEQGPGAAEAPKALPADPGGLRASAARVRPWEQSTGPRTPQGKANSRRNAWKHGERSAGATEMRAMLAGCLRVLRESDHALADPTRRCTEPLD